MSIVDPGRAEIALFVAYGRIFARRSYRRFVDSLRLRGDETVMEFGSGPGVMAKLIADRLAPRGGTLACVDISQKWIEVAKKNLRGYSNASFLLGDIRSLPVPDSSFDVIAVHLVLHDVNPQMRPGAVAALARVLRQDGRIVIEDPARTSHSMPVSEIRRLFAEAGMNEVDSWRTWSLFHAEYRKGSRPQMTSR